jgi:hypothetical protein
MSYCSMNTNKNSEPSFWSHHSSQTTYQSTVIIPSDKVIYRNLNVLATGLSVRTISNTKQTLRWTVMKTRPITEAKQMKQCVCNIPCECGRSYIVETSRPIEVRIKEHKCNLIKKFSWRFKINSTCKWRRPQDMLERSKGPANWTQ